MQMNMEYMNHIKSLHKKDVSESIDRIIFGKNTTERIVSVEVDESDIVLFIETENGIKHKFLKNDYWILSNKKRGSDFKRLDGNLYYNYIRKFGSRDDFMEARREGFKYNDFSIYDAAESAMILNGITYFKGMNVQDVSVLSFDIEATGLVHNKDSNVLLISNTFRKNGKITKKLFCYDDYTSDSVMIDEWCDWVRKMDPSFIIGHNIFGYDLPYLNHCSDGGLMLGRDDSMLEFREKPSKKRKDGSQSYEYYNASIFGREIIDTMFLSINYDIVRKYESYGLKQIIKQEGLEKTDRQHYDASKIAENYKIPSEWEKIKTYAKDDADDALALYDLMINSYFYYARSIPKSFQMINNSSTGSQLNSFLLRSYLQDSHSVPMKSEIEKYDGGISWGNPGLYKNVFKIDIKSQYPSIILRDKVYDRNKDPKGNFLKMVEYFTKERFKNKKLAKETGDRYYSDLEKSGKLVINSSYGLLGAPGLNFNSLKWADHITSEGRKLLEQAVKWATGKDYKDWNPDADK